MFNKRIADKPVELLDYILDRGDEPCGPSVPGAILSAMNSEEIGDEQ